MKGLAHISVSAGLLFSALFCIVSGQYNEDSKEALEKSPERTVTAVINPKCPDNVCTNFTLVHVEQRGKSDVLHHIWTMERVPVLYFARTDLEAELLINWEDVGTTNISFSKEPQYFAAVVFSKFMLFNDLNDTGVVPEGCDESSVISFDTRQMDWHLESLNLPSNTTASVTFRLAAYQGIKMDPDSNIKMTLTSYGSRNRSPILPHLAYTENSTQVDLVFDQVHNEHSFANARLAVEVAAIDSEPDSHYSMQVSRSLDDEYTPGVFKLMEVRSSHDQHWLQWRPVCYTSTDRDIADSTGLTQTDVRYLTDSSILTDSLIGWLNLSSTFIQGFNLTFGVEGDGFYTASNYTAWTMVTGYGKPVDDEFSLMVILVMAVGLGLPAVVLFIGGIAIAVRNYRMGKDDLLLSN